MFREIGFSTVLIIAFLSGVSQPYLTRDQSIIVLNGNKTLALAWVGGLNNPQFSTMDFNEDNINDLFIFDKSGGVIIPLLQNGSSGTQKFSFEAKYIDRFPEVGDWALLRDFNCDGYPDLFTYSKFGPGAMVYKNNQQVGNNWFSLSDSLLLSHIELGGTSGTTNIFISRVDFPAILDYDDDGDLDIFTFQVTGFQLEFYKNFSVENGNGCGFDFDLKNRCWGYFSESLEENSIVLGQDCFNVDNPERSVEEINAHSGSTILLLDLNNDGYQDIVMGDVSFNRLTSMVNGGPSTVQGLDSMISVNYEFPDSLNPGGMNTFPAAYYEDVNNDQVKDLIVAPNAQFGSDDVNAVKLYLNVGTNDNPVFEFTNNSFLQEDMIDIGEGAYPLLFDVNQDGLTDLLIGNRKRIQDSIQTSSIAYYQNTGSAGNPQFNFITADYFEISQHNIGQGLFPTFIDLNGDDVKDLVLGNISGNLFYLLNKANAGQPFDFSGEALILSDNMGSIIDVGQMAKPQAFDLNNDGLVDLAIGTRTGNIVYYENTGSKTNPEFTWKKDTLGNVVSPGFLSNTGYAAPFFYNENGETKLILGSETGQLFYFTSITNNLDGSFEEFSGPATDIWEGMRSVPTRGDINDDGLPDLMLGNYRGGVSFFKGSNTIPDGGFPSDLEVFIYPNPAYNQLTIELLNADEFEVSFYNGIGQMVYSQKFSNQNKTTINVSNFASGSYIAEVKYDPKHYMYHFIIVNQ